MGIALSRQRQSPAPRLARFAAVPRAARPSTVCAPVQPMPSRSSTRYALRTLNSCVGRCRRPSTTCEGSSPADRMARSCAQLEHDRVHVAKTRTRGSVSSYSTVPPNSLAACHNELERPLRDLPIDCRARSAETRMQASGLADERHLGVHDVHRLSAIERCRCWHGGVGTHASELHPIDGPRHPRDGADRPFSGSVPACAARSAEHRGECLRGRALPSRPIRPVHPHRTPVPMECCPLDCSALRATTIACAATCAICRSASCGANSSTVCAPVQPMPRIVDQMPFELNSCASLPPPVETCEGSRPADRMARSANLTTEFMSENPNAAMRLVSSYSTVPPNSLAASSITSRMCRSAYRAAADAGCGPGRRASPRRARCSSPGRR